ncbi:MAG: hypothetical protein A2177_14910 [Spirochaetes bacterium RBG_13_68_11]|nr:MAG: hypothetical protein A2177_14910 [Spirochaetes bacterium RBG_13_68_11]
MALLASRNGTVRWPDVFFMSRKLNVNAERRSRSIHRRTASPIRTDRRCASATEPPCPAPSKQPRSSASSASISAGFTPATSFFIVSASRAFTVAPTVAFSFAGGV